MDTNPYAPPKHDDVALGRAVDEPSAELERIRAEHINTEANIKAIGFLLYLGAAGLVLSGLTTRLSGVPLASALSLVFGIAVGVGGYWLRRFDKRGRLVYSIIAALGIVGILVSSDAGGPLALKVGRLFWPLVLLAILWSGKATTVMTDHYRDVVIPATPHVKRKTSTALLVVILLLVLLVGVVLFINTVD